MNTKPVILIVDDEPHTRQGYRWALEKLDAEFLEAKDGEEALLLFQSNPINILITDLRMPKMDGSSLVAHVRKEYPNVSIIIITGHGTVESAVEALKNGVDDYLVKPVSIDELTIRVERLLKSYRQEHEIEQLQERIDEKFGFASIVGKSAAMMDVFERVRMVAPTRANVLIYGESGTGKEMIAEAIHQNSSRKNKPFIKVNCGALSLSLLESELFGHEKGAFTGAVTQREGRFEVADGGTILLDEISETSPEFQVKLLRVLQEGTFERVGGTKTITCDVRVLASSNKRLADLVSEGKFREDLYYRLKVIEIVLPPLRERQNDIPLLVDHYLNEFANYNGRTKPPITTRALQVLERAPWPGNVRQLRNVIEGIVVMLPKGKTIDVENLPEDITQSPHHENCVHIPIGTSLSDAEKEIIIATLRANGNGRAETARILGVGRKTLYRKIDTYGIDSILSEGKDDNNEKE
ncbi:MAG: sigma-54 dependent transcriptional regulator [Candidatus Sumerlaeales bacterium]|nr:sigma-54 dependent transcriptional regulator [Candidatus Sumerlaeales bacterium]